MEVGGAADVVVRYRRPVADGATLDELLERIKHQLTKLGPILELEVACEPQARTRGG